MTEFRESGLCVHWGWGGGGVSGSTEQIGPSSHKREHSEASFTAQEYPSPGLTCPAFGLLGSPLTYSTLLGVPD